MLSLIVVGKKEGAEVAIANYCGGGVEWRHVLGSRHRRRGVDDGQRIEAGEAGRVGGAAGGDFG